MLLLGLPLSSANASNRLLGELITVTDGGAGVNVAAVLGGFCAMQMNGLGKCWPSPWTHRGKGDPVSLFVDWISPLVCFIWCWLLGSVLIVPA